MADSQWLWADYRALLRHVAQLTHTGVGVDTAHASASSVSVSGGSGGDPDLVEGGALLAQLDATLRRRLDAPAVAFVVRQARQHQPIDTSRKTLELTGMMMQFQQYVMQYPPSTVALHSAAPSPPSAASASSSPPVTASPSVDAPSVAPSNGPSAANAIVPQIHSPAVDSGSSGPAARDPSRPAGLASMAARSHSSSSNNSSHRDSSSTYVNADDKTVMSRCRSLRVGVWFASADFERTLLDELQRQYFHVNTDGLLLPLMHRCRVTRMADVCTAPVDGQSTRIMDDRELQMRFRTVRNATTRHTRRRFIRCVSIGFVCSLHLLTMSCLVVLVYVPMLQQQAGFSADDVAQWTFARCRELRVTSTTPWQRRSQRWHHDRE